MFSAHNITLYHGSRVRVPVPLLERCRDRNDYGRAFYCTLERDLACEWACPDGRSPGYVNEYTLDTEGLEVLDLDEDPNGVLAWIAVLLTNRTLDKEWNVDGDTARFVNGFAVDLAPFDIVEGYRADDSYFSIARAFVSGTITDAQLARTLGLDGLGRQVALRTERALGALRFVGAAAVDASVFGPRRLARDRRARSALLGIRSEGGKASGRRIYELGV